MMYDYIYRCMGIGQQSFHWRKHMHFCRRKEEQSKAGELNEFSKFSGFLEPIFLTNRFHVEVLETMGSKNLIILGYLSLRYKKQPLLSWTRNSKKWSEATKIASFSSICPTPTWNRSWSPSELSGTDRNLHEPWNEWMVFEFVVRRTIFHNSVPCFTLKMTLRKQTHPRVPDLWLCNTSICMSRKYQRFTFFFGKLHLRNIISMLFFFFFFFRCLGSDFWVL